MIRMPGFVSAPIAKAVVISAALYAKWVDNMDLRQVSPVNAIAHALTPILLIHGLDFRTPAWNSQKPAGAVLVRTTLSFSSRKRVIRPLGTIVN